MRFSWLLAWLLLSTAGCAPNRVNDHSAGRDPDIAPTDTLANVAREIHVGQSALNPRPLPPVATRTMAAPQVEAEAAPETPAEVVPEVPPMPPHLEVAHRFIGVTEQPKDSNRGPEVESFLAAVGLAPKQDASGDWKSYPYCAAFVSYCLNIAGDGVAFPTKRTAAARQFIDDAHSIVLADDADAFAVRGGSIRANVVQRGTVPIPPGTIVIWKAKRAPEDLQGHAGLVVSWEGQAGVTIEGNTGAGEAGDQREGGGVYLRKRMLSPGSAFRIVSFTPVTYR
ncbi:MAG: CHAP domain-containing protein [Rhodothermales bacterium]|nr:CHAP domain-containing protein [Rhodothermales bacterium]